MCVKCLSHKHDMKPFLFCGIWDKADTQITVYFLHVKVGHMCRLHNQLKENEFDAYA